MIRDDLIGARAPNGVEVLAHDLGFGLLPEGGDVVESACLSSHVNADRATPGTLKRAYEAIGVTGPQLELIRGEAEALAEHLRGA